MKNLHRQILLTLGVIFFISTIANFAHSEGGEERFVVWISKESSGPIGPLLALPPGGYVRERKPARLTFRLRDVDSYIAFWERRSFYRNFGFTIKEEHEIEEGELREKHRVEKLYSFTRPGDESTVVSLGIGRCEEGNEGQIMVATLDFELADTNRELWIESFLGMFGIEERRYGKEPLNFIQGSMVQKQNRTAEIKIPGDISSRYKIGCYVIQKQ